MTDIGEQTGLVSRPEANGEDGDGDVNAERAALEALPLLKRLLLLLGQLQVGHHPLHLWLTLIFSQQHRCNLCLLCDADILEVQVLELYSKMT